MRMHFIDLEKFISPDNEAQSSNAWNGFAKTAFVAHAHGRIDLDIPPAEHFGSLWQRENVVSATRLTRVPEPRKLFKKEAVVFLAVHFTDDARAFFFQQLLRPAKYFSTSAPSTSHFRKSGAGCVHV